jgi:SAM-dependent methyltransferase
MPSSARTPAGAIDFRFRAQLTERMDEPCTREELRACLHDIVWSNRLLLGYRPLFGWLGAIVPNMAVRPIRLLDAGCGNGDVLRRIEHWTRKHNLPMQLIGIDLNPDAIVIAAELTPGESNIQWAAADIFDYQPQSGVDCVVSSLFTHHLSESEIVRFIEWMEKIAAVGWFINDLSRAAAPYYLYRTFAKVLRLHPFVQNDGPISIARAFVPEDWQRMCASAGLAPGDFEIQAFKPARLCVARRKQ